MRPYTPEEIDVEPRRITKRSTPRIMIGYPGDTIAQLSGVIVETWDHVVPVSSRSGSKSRKYLVEFTEAERGIISRYHHKMYGWTMRTGHPQEIVMESDTYTLLRRAADFFASV